LARNIEITGRADHEFKHFENTGDDKYIHDCVLDDGSFVRVQSWGTDDRHVIVDRTYTFYGYWGEYRNEKQFVTSNYHETKPHDRPGVVAYLQLLKGIGRGIADALWEKYEHNAVEQLRLHPEEAAREVPALHEAVAVEASLVLATQERTEKSMIDMQGLLAGRGFPRSLPVTLIQEYGSEAPAEVKARPYMLMRFPGCGFKICDSLYLDLGHPPDAIERQGYCMWQAVRTNGSGDTWHPVEVTWLALDAAIGGATTNPREAMAFCRDNDLLAQCWTEEDGMAEGLLDPLGDTHWVADRRDADNEGDLAILVADKNNETIRWPALSLNSSVSEHQQEKIAKATSGGPIAILGGGPGTGKTYCASKIIRALLQIYRTDQIAVAAPTGKAAVRVTEAMNDEGIPKRATTIHSLLRVVQSGIGGWSFEYDWANKLPHKVFVIDELSMLDTALARALFDAIPKGSLVLLIGDVNQLPPIGCGAPLRDFIEADIPYGELTEVQRNSGEIVQACKDIREGRNFRFGGNLQLRFAPTPNHQLDEVLAVIDSLGDDIDPMWDVQVICPINEKSGISRAILNERLQTALNKNPAIPGTKFRVGDKAVNLSNAWMPHGDCSFCGGKKSCPECAGDDIITNKDGKVYVANGELGRITKIESKRYFITLDNPRRHVIALKFKAGDDEGDSASDSNWDLGYALSVHKYQGSEVPVAITILDESAAAARLCSREWIYTAISRGKKITYCIGREETAQNFCLRTVVDKRKTFLVQKIRAKGDDGPHLP
jgi:exodeoxyribonuclease V alpha subunit